MQRSTSPVLFILIAVLILGGSYWYINRQRAAPPVLATPQPAASPPNAPPILQGTPSAVLREITLDSGNFFFKPSKITLKKDETVRIKVTNDGLHTFTIDELFVNQSLRGSEVTFDFTPEKAGTFTYYCAIPGHRERGQFGTLVVEE